MTIVYFRQKKRSPGDFQRIQRPKIWHFHTSSRRGRTVAHWLHMQEVLGSNPSPVFLVKDMCSGVLWFPGDHKYCQKSRNLWPYLSGKYFRSPMQKDLNQSFSGKVSYLLFYLHYFQDVHKYIFRKLESFTNKKLNRRRLLSTLPYLPWHQIHLDLSASKGWRCLMEYE